MGAKTWMLVYTDGNVGEILKSKPKMDRAATAELAQRLFPKEKLLRLEDGDLSYTSPPNNELLLACYPGLNIVAAKEFGIDYPSRLPPRFLDPALGSTVYLHAMHSVVDWFAYAVWVNGKLERALSLSPDDGVMENIGQPLAFEQAYWSGQFPEDADYPFPFHPLELGEATLAALFGYQLEGVINPSLLEPETIPLARFKRSNAWWKFW